LRRKDRKRGRRKKCCHHLTADHQLTHATLMDRTRYDALDATVDGCFLPLEEAINAL